MGSKDKDGDGGFKFPDFVSLEDLKNAVNRLPDNIWKERYFSIIKPKGINEGGDEKSEWEKFLVIFYFEFNSLFSRKVVNVESKNEVEVGFDVYLKNLDELLRTGKMDGASKSVIKDFADNVLRIYQISKYFALEKKRKWVEDYEMDVFYTNLEYGYLNFYQDAYEKIVKPYNRFRNFLTRKPYSQDKWKLNFGVSTLGGGWDKNKEKDNLTLIFKKDGNYFIGIMHKGHKNIFSDKFISDFDMNGMGRRYEKLVYKLFPDPAKMFPKVCFSAKGLVYFQPSEEIMNIYNSGEFRNGDNFSVESMQKLIDFYKDCLTKYDGWKGYDFRNLKPTKEYVKNIGEFYNDVAEAGYKLSFQSVSEEYIRKVNEEGKLYLFRICNKDFSSKSTGKKNLHSMYFESLFLKENFERNFVHKLSGGAELFFRPKTEIGKLGVKFDKKGKEVVKHKRYSEDKVFFHVSVILNRTSKDVKNFNSIVNDFLAVNKDIKVIGVDRGEKHLAYWALVDRNGRLLKSGSLNKVGGIDYGAKLEERAKSREKARQDWQNVQGIKDLKKGYISQVVHELAELVIEHNAIVVFEDLNMRFKQIRGGIEKSIYQQLEKALIEKLSFYVRKGEVDPNKAGNLMKAFQLAKPVDSFADMGKQTGVIFYTQAAYTSKIDPKTGWRPNLYLKYTNAEKAKAEILNFSKIEFVNDRFEFTYDLKNFRRQKEWPKKTVWTICSSVERYRWNPNLNNNKGGYDYYSDLTENLKNLFEEFHVNYRNGNILNQIEVINEKGNERLFRDLVFYVNLICQIRNTSDSAEDIQSGKSDFLLSPVYPFFDSRIVERGLPGNGDENGAFNIARKGLMILDKIERFYAMYGSCEKMSWRDLYIGNTEWDDFVVG